MVVAGHYIVQTGENAFWDPNHDQALQAHGLAFIKRHHVALSARADALQIDVVPK